MIKYKIIDINNWLDSVAYTTYKMNKKKTTLEIMLDLDEINELTALEKEVALEIVHALRNGSSEYKKVTDKYKDSGTHVIENLVTKLEKVNKMLEHGGYILYKIENKKVTILEKTDNHIKDNIIINFIIKNEIYEEVFETTNKSAAKLYFATAL